MRKTFYTFNNNNFLKTNAYLKDDPKANSEFELSVKPIDKEALFLNNQKISDSIHSLKNSSIKKISNLSLPKLATITAAPGKGLSVKRQESFPTPTKLKNQTFIAESSSSKIVSPQTSSLVQSAVQMRSSSPNTKNSKRPILIATNLKISSNEQDLSPDLISSSEKRVITSVKLAQDRVKTQSRSVTKRNVSYISDTLNNLVSSGQDKEYQSARKHVAMFGESPRSSKVHSSYQTTRNETFKLQAVTSNSVPSQFKNALSRETGSSAIFNFDQRCSSEPQVNMEALQENPSPFGEYFVLNGGGVGENLNTLDQSLEKRPRTRKAFEIGTKEGAYIPRIWTAVSYAREGSAQSPNRTIKEESLLGEVRKEMPHFFTEAPSSRQDVIALAHWMEEKINTINKGSINEREKFAKYDQVYNLCLNECLRQVSVDCLERGELLYKIWMNYFKMMSQYKTSLDHEREKVQAHYKRESQRLFVDMEDLTMKTNENIEACKKEIQKLIEEKTETEKQLQKITQKSVRQTKKVEKFVGILNAMKNQIKTLTEENKAYVAKQERIQEYGNKYGTKFKEVPKRSSRIPLDKSSQVENIKMSQNTLMATSVQVVGDGQVTQIKTVDSEESNHSDSNAPSLDFIYEDMTEMEKLAKTDPKKAALLDDGTINAMKNDNMCDAEAQTHLFLINSKYDVILENQKIIDDVIIEFKLRQEVDGLFDVTSLTLDENLTPMAVQEKLSNNFYATKNRINSIQELVDDIEDKKVEKSLLKKKSSKHERSTNAGKKLIKSRSAQVTIQIGEKKFNKEGDLIESAANHLDTKTLNLENSNIGYSIEESLKIEQTQLTDLSAEQDKTIKEQNNFQIFINQQDNQRDEDRVTQSSNERPSIENVDSNSHKEDQSMLNEYREQTSYNSEETQNLNEITANNIDENTMQIIEETTEEECNSPRFSSNNHLNNPDQISPPLKSGSTSQAYTQRSPSLRDDKSKAPQHQTGLGEFQPKQEKNSLYDKARLLLVGRLYKVQLEKNKLLTNNHHELQEQFLAEKQNIAKLEETVNELNDEIKDLKLNLRPAICNKCSYCNRDRQNNGSKTDITGDLDGPSGLLDHLDEDFDDDDEVDGEKTSKSGKRSAKKKPLTRAVSVIPPDGKRDKSTTKVNNTQAALAIIEKIKSKKMSKFKNFMPIKAVCKQIHNFYQERIKQAKENNAIKDEPFASFVYTWFATFFGFKKLAEQKFIVFVLSIKKYLHIVRINLFARFMSLLDGTSNFNLDEFNKYLEALDFINTSSLGFPMTNNETDSKQYTPFLRAIEYVKTFSENKMSTEEYIDFKKEIEALKENDPKNLNRNGIIDIDRFVSKILAKYRVICNKTKQFVVNAFKAADLDGNKYCSLKEFCILYRNIESDKYDYDFVENLFTEHADVRVEGEVNLSFDKFTVVCVEYGLFSDSQQDQFLGILNKEGLKDKMEKLKRDWPSQHLELNDKLESLTKVPEEEKKFWLDILNILQERLSIFEAIDFSDIKPILIAYEILEKEVKDLAFKEAELDQYGVVKMTQDTQRSQRTAAVEDSENKDVNTDRD